MRKSVYFGIIAMVIFLSSCATTQYNKNTTSQKEQKIAILNYEMARNIVLHKDYLRLSDAFKYLKQAKKVFPNDPKIYYITALAYQLRKDQRNYVIYLNKTIEKDKNFFDAYNALGIYNYEKGFYTRAIDIFTKLTLNPLYPNTDIAFFNRSRVYIKLGKLDKAENDIKSALIFSNEKNMVYWKNLISIQLIQKKYIEALKNLYDMEQYMGSSYYIYYTKAFCYMKLSMFDKAKNELDKIKDDSPEYTTLKAQLLKKIDANNTNN